MGVVLGTARPRSKSRGRSTAAPPPLAVGLVGARFHLRRLPRRLGRPSKQPLQACSGRGTTCCPAGSDRVPLGCQRGQCMDASGLGGTARVRARTADADWGNRTNEAPPRSGSEAQHTGRPSLAHLFGWRVPRSTCAAFRFGWGSFSAPRPAVLSSCPADSGFDPRPGRQVPPAAAPHSPMPPHGLLIACMLSPCCRCRSRCSSQTACPRGEGAWCSLCRRSQPAALRPRAACVACCVPACGACFLPGASSICSLWSACCYLPCRPTGKIQRRHMVDAFITGKGAGGRGLERGV